MEWILITLILGVILVCAELFIPGGILGTIGGLFLLASFFLVFNKYDTATGFYYLIGVVVLTGLCVYLTSKIVPRTSIGRSLFLKESESGYSSFQEDLSFLKGREGMAVTLLRPAGVAKIEGRRTDVVTEGDLISKGSRVRVTEVEGNRVVVRKID